MHFRTFVIGCTLALALLLFAQRHAEMPQPAGFRAVVDLTHSVNGKVPTYELAEQSAYQVKTVATIEKDKYFARNISLPEHYGTHIDAPAHFAPGMWTVDQIPPERLIRPLVVIDVSAKVKENPDYQVSVEDIAAWEHANGEMPLGAVVMARTGWDSRWDSVKDYRNADAKGMMHFPGYSLDAAKFLVEGRNVVGLGIDTLSVDFGPSNDFEVHQYTLAHSIYHLENVANLDRAPAKGAMVVVAPMKLEGGSGGPVRIFALLP
ncbi:MAG TPA: cyclase family protein [Terriglobales bacterium]|jgi:kynurenine formamidase|nr:cyclase family protein [Terriglobales bacterium]